MSGGRHLFVIRPGRAEPSIVAFFFVDAYRRRGRLNDLKGAIILQERALSERGQRDLGTWLANRRRSRK